MTFDVEKIQDFLDQGDKSPPPVFVGRGDVLRDIEAAGETAWQGQSETVAGEQASRGVPGMTRVLQGAPGAGKSSVLSELTRRSSERDGAPAQSRVVTVGSRQLLDGLTDVLRAVAVAGTMRQDQWRAVSRTLTLGVSAGPVKALVETAWAKGARESENLSDMEGRHPPETWQAPVIVAVDETQRLPGNAVDPHALFLQGIHDADGGLPLSLVLAGLGNTRDVAYEMGLTRGTTIHEIDGLGRNDCMTLMTGFCRHFGIDPSGHEEQLDALAVPCHGWPRHLHFALQALADEVERCEGVLADVDWGWCKDKAAESRAHYYRNQQSPAMKGPARLLTGVVMQGLAPGMTRLDVLQLIEDNAGDRLGHRLPKGMDAEDFFLHLVHRGALQEREDDTIHSPIPSFRAYLIRAGGLTPEADKDLDVSGTRKDGDDGTDFGT